MNKKYAFKILQLKKEERLEELLFLRFSRAQSHGGVNLDNYEEVYSGIIEEKASLPVECVLEELYRIFNVAHPDDYKARSLSLSDVISISPCDKEGKELEQAKNYYVDAFGFQVLAQGSAS